MEGSSERASVTREVKYYVFCMHLAKQVLIINNSAESTKFAWSQVQDNLLSRWLNNSWYLIYSPPCVTPRTHLLSITIISIFWGKVILFSIFFFLNKSSHIYFNEF